MKSLVIAIASLIASVSVNAQNSTVYYAPVTTNMEVGLGFDRATNKCILSIIEEADKTVDFNFDIINMNGESVLANELNEGSINIMPKDKDDNYYQCNYALSVPELMDIIVNAKDNTIVINGTQVSSKALASAIENVQKEISPAAQPKVPARFIPRMHRPVRLVAFAR
ncbi:MAG: hypothetical protein J5720_07930 [Bacteroidaceae bacterium]|nr:hypothetical protein [Bacteroidaceae bacterium]